MKSTGKTPSGKNKSRNAFDAKRFVLSTFNAAKFYGSFDSFWHAETGILARARQHYNLLECEWGNLYYYLEGLFDSIQHDVQMVWYWKGVTIKNNWDTMPDDLKEVIRKTSSTDLKAQGYIGSHWIKKDGSIGNKYN